MSDNDLPGVTARVTDTDMDGAIIIDHDDLSVGIYHPANQEDDWGVLTKPPERSQDWAVRFYWPEKTALFAWIVGIFYNCFEYPGSDPGAMLITTFCGAVVTWFVCRVLWSSYHSRHSF